MTHSNNFVDVLFQKHVPVTPTLFMVYTTRTKTTTLCETLSRPWQQQAFGLTNYTLILIGSLAAKPISAAELTVRRPHFPGINADFFFFGTHQWFSCLLLSVTRVSEFWNQLIHWTKTVSGEETPPAGVFWSQFLRRRFLPVGGWNRGAF